MEESFMATSNDVMITGNICVCMCVCLCVLMCVYAHVSDSTFLFVYADADDVRFVRMCVCMRVRMYV